MADDVTEQCRARAERDAMMAELDHRSKNVLALAIAEQTLARCSSVEEFRESFVGRLRSFSGAHEALAAAHCEAVDLSRLVEVGLGPLAGPDLRAKSTGLGLGLVRGFIEHELGGALTTRVDAKRRSYQRELPLVESDS